MKLSGQIIAFLAIGESEISISQESNHEWIYSNDISFSKLPNLFVNFVAAETITDTGCTHYSDRARLSSGYTDNVTDLLKEGDEWALYYTFENPNEYYLLNKKRSRKCLDAWLTVLGSCTGTNRPINFVKWGDS